MLCKKVVVDPIYTSTIILHLRQRCEHVLPPEDCIIRITESFRLEKTFKIIKSNRSDITDIFIQGLQLSVEISPHLLVH